MAVIGKFFVQEIVHHEGQPTADRVKLGAVCRGPQNRQWSAATPWGQIEMGVLNDAATAYFEQGEEYEVTFRHVPKPTPGDGHEPIPSFAPWDHEQKHPECEFCGMALYSGGEGATAYDGMVKHDELYGQQD
jgi:hypothetical protein